MSNYYKIIFILFTAVFSLLSASSVSAMLLVNKKVINLTSVLSAQAGNLNWSEAVSANPYDTLSFAITLEATGGRDIHNIVIRDILPPNLIYRGNLTVNNSFNYFGNPFSGINIGTIPAGGMTVIAYQAQVAGPENFSYGATAMNNMITVSADEINNQIDNATVIVNKSLIYGAANINTGLTNNFFTDSLLFPLLLIVSLILIVRQLYPKFKSF